MEINYSNYFLVFLTFVGLWPRVLRYRDGMVDEKVTVVSIFPEIAHFFGTEAGNALAAIGNIHEGDSHILR